jgi:hypothetical protein
MGLFSHRQNNPGIPGRGFNDSSDASDPSIRPARAARTRRRTARTAMPRRCDDDDANEKTRAARAAARFERRDPTQRADGVSKRQNQKRRKRSPDDVQLPTSPGGGGRAGAGSGAGRRAGAGSGAGRRAGVSTRRSEHAPDGANGKRPLPAPAYDARDRCFLVRAWHLGASRCILDRARHHDRA